MRSIVNHLRDALRDDRADAVDRGELLLARRATIASRSAKLRASACAAVGPTWLMPSPTSTRHSGRCFDASIASTSSCADRSPIRSSGTSALDGERVDVGRVLEQPGLDELAHALLAEPFDVHRAAARPVHEPLLALRRAVDVDAVVVRLALDPHERLRRTPGTSSGTSTPCVRGGRLASTGPTTSGITSPARRTITVSPGRTSLRATSSSLCSVAMPTLAPPTNTGSSTANGVARPVRPMLTMMSRRIVVFSSGGNLYAIAQRGARDVKPISARWPRSSTFTTTPSIS